MSTRLTTLIIASALTACGVANQAADSSTDDVGRQDVPMAADASRVDVATNPGTDARVDAGTPDVHNVRDVVIVQDAAAVTGAPGVWENVTPSQINLDPSTNSGGNFGVQDVLADPVHPGTFYAFVCYQGVWKSTDWGTTWSNVSTDGELEQGRPWGEAIAPDGSYMLACSGYGLNEGAWKSTDGGATWHSHGMGGSGDPYSFDIDPSDARHAIGSTHSTDIIYESHDGGETWSARGPSGAGASNYVFFITSTTWLCVPQSGKGAGTLRTTDSGGTWAQVGPMDHAHGNEQIYIDPDNNAIYVPSHDGGIYRSTDGGATFSQVSSTRGSTLFATATHLYSMDPGANSAGTDPTLQIATRRSGTDWTSVSTPAGMTNGAKRAGVAFDQASGRWVIVGGNWNAGIWRYIEPSQ